MVLSVGVNHEKPILIHHRDAVGETLTLAHSAHAAIPLAVALTKETLPEKVDQWGGGSGAIWNRDQNRVRSGNRTTRNNRLTRNKTYHRLRSHYIVLNVEKGLSSLYGQGPTSNVTLAIRARTEPQADVFDYIERFYNPKQRHSTLG